MFAENVIFIPGPHVALDSHWIYNWAHEFGTLHVLQPIHVGPPQRSLYVKALEREVAKYPDGSVWVVAHDLGCHAVAHWASVTTRKLAGAFLVSPPDIRKYETKHLTIGFWPHATKPFPFPSMLVMANNDNLCFIQVGHSYASLWQSYLVNVGPKGHLLRNDGIGQWAEGLELFKQFAEENDVEVARVGASWVHGGFCVSPMR
ncbi:MAG: alpha/beta hydrolase [Breznakibacter sp.]